MCKKKTDKVITILHADDFADRTSRLGRAVDSMARKLGNLKNMTRRFSRSLRRLQGHVTCVTA